MVDKDNDGQNPAREFSTPHKKTQKKSLQNKTKGRIITVTTNERNKMIIEDPTTTYHYNIERGETPEQARQGGPTSATKHWTIKVNEREWTLTATRYFDRDGGQSKPFWRIWESGDNRRDHDGDVNINQPFDGEGPVKVGVNWPAKGTQDLQDTLRFKRDLGEAVQAATDAEYIIKYEAEEA